LGCAAAFPAAAATGADSGRAPPPALSPPPRTLEHTTWQFVQQLRVELLF
jgi:hypothetical protein